MFKKLHIKLTAYMGVVLIVFMLFVATGIYNFTKVVFEDGTKKLMQSEAIRIYTYNDSFFSEGIFKERDTLFNLGPKLAIMGSEKLEASYVIYNEKFERVYEKKGESEIADAIATLAVDSFCTKTDSYATKRVSGINYRIYTKYFDTNSGPGIVQVFQNTINEEIIWSFLKTVLLLFGSTGMLILLCISYIFTGKALKPVKDTWKRQKEFIADASHELRTPLTVIQTNLDVVLSDDEGTVEENEMWLDNAYSETRVMAKLIDQLLTLAKADSNDEKLDISEISLTEIIENICANMDIIAKNKDIDFELINNEDILIKGDYDKIRRMIVILIDNAIKYTESGKVTVKLYTEKNKKVLTVEDTGIGISKYDMDRIFDRFYRADKARHREGGTGLGLSIAKWIADIHKFSLTVESVMDEGTKFTLKM
ncbi:signal transduction histidine kinase [Sedimentibacter acidaminivorans]|jgi:signal transduction histidine kinase|uniref:histidine kinase n=1 Tax=Sedimentibacter acidaminivorans TaxID=913099 RepID=A0ABS4GDD4_9FIRM|nr:HAMP domain-containing sensor histidine kinase [Sedimentibacter acidaminivorans]MBP1925694.1 signal transduction histidine kinase [Sedimentibacter acidaminivorans]